MNSLFLCLSLGACLTATDLRLRVQSANATRVEVCLFAKAQYESEKVCLPMARADRSAAWDVSVSREQMKTAGLNPEEPVYYGYRAWGPNWPYDPAWTPGSAAGFVTDVDNAGNRFNPNKVLLDPYALEVSHGLESVIDPSIFTSGPSRRLYDSAGFVPKGVVAFGKVPPFQAVKPARAFKDEVIYEVHVKGLTANDPEVPMPYRGTYRGAAYKARYLKELGVTAVEFLPLHQMISTFGNYWGYMPLAYFAPQRSYAHDKSAGGPTKEFRAMVDAFHREGIKVYTDVVYNHTGEGGMWENDPAVAQLVSFRGLDNATYYTLSRNPAYYMDHTGCGNDLAAHQETVRNLILESLAYWKDQLGVDGFRFDLASVLGNVAGGGAFHFDKGDPRSVLNRARAELPVRPAAGGAGVDLIAEPWALGNGTYQQGQFPAGWAEWNGGAFRDPVRAFFNKRGVEPVTLGDAAHALSGSPNLFETSARRPWHSVNFITAHDGFTLRDLFSYNHKVNSQPMPWGPSDGGTDDNRSWDQNGNPVQQRQMARTAFVALLMSLGTPMISGGDEFYRTLRGNNNPYNLDTVANYLPWPDRQDAAKLTAFVRHLLGLRARVEGLRPHDFFRGEDRNGDGVRDLTWYSASGEEMSAREFNSAGGFLAYRIDNSEFAGGHDVRSILIAINADFQPARWPLPAIRRRGNWVRAVDTAAWFEKDGNFDREDHEPRVRGDYVVQARSAVILLEKN